MKAVIHFTKAEEARALPILLRHSAGTILPDRTYVLDEEVVAELRKCGVSAEFALQTRCDGYPNGEVQRRLTE